MEIKKGDNVVIITGKDKGKKGKVLETSPKKSKLIVENVNIVTKHKKPKSAQDKGGRIQKANPIDISKAMVICSTCNKATRVSHKVVNGKKVRICKKCSASLDKEFVKAVKKETKKVENTEVKVAPKSAEKSKEVVRTVKKPVDEKKVVKTTKTTTVKTAKQQKIGSKGQ
mgnify:CR=1 FL=1